MTTEENFYKEICEAKELEQEKEICQKYDKDYKKVRSCIDQAMKIDMMSSNNSREIFHERIVYQLKSKGL